MNRPFVKVCGITRLDDARLAVELGADAIGFVFAPGSPRRIAPTDAARIARALPAGAARVVVAVNAAPDDVLAWRDLIGLDALQAHGEETPELCARYPLPVVKAVPSRPGLGPGALEPWRSRPLLLDGYDAVRRGGTGRPADWGLARALAGRGFRVILAGGLAPENLADAIAAATPLAVDLGSGVESAPGRKDPVRLAAAFALLAPFPAPPPEERPW